MATRAAIIAALCLTACGGEVADADGNGAGNGAGDGDPTGNAGGASHAPEVLFLVASSASGVTTNEPLISGVTYDVTIQGSISVWSPNAWASVCAGTPGPAPEFPSPGVTGPTGLDAAWVWAWPTSSPSLCPSGSPTGAAPLGRSSHVLYKTSADAAPVKLIALEKSMTANHAYTYRIVGEGAPGIFQIYDAHPSDNYGELRIQIAAE